MDSCDLKQDWKCWGIPETQPATLRRAELRQTTLPGNVVVAGTACAGYLGHKAHGQHFQRAENQSLTLNLKPLEEPGARAQDEIPAVRCHMTQAESFPTIQKKI